MKAKMNSKADNSCKFCSKVFTSERTLSSHMCVKKRRWTDKDTIGARLGFRVFQRFSELSTNSKKVKTDMDFINSPYYADFVKFGRYLVELDPVYPEKFIDFVIRNGVKLKDWTASYVYDAYMGEMTKTELPEAAVERTILEMSQWCDANIVQLSDFFKSISAVEATFKIRAGRISPWVLYLAESADFLMSRLSPEQGKIIHTAIDPSKWQVIFMLKKADVDFVQTVLKESGL